VVSFSSLRMSYLYSHFSYMCTDANFTDVMKEEYRSLLFLSTFRIIES